MWKLVFVITNKERYNRQAHQEGIEAWKQVNIKTEKNEEIVSQLNVTPVFVLPGEPVQGRKNVRSTSLQIRLLTIFLTFVGL